MKEKDINEPFIPYKISNLAINYSIPFIFISGLVSMAYNHILLAFLLFCVYITSNLHWSHIEQQGIIRNIDMGCALSTFIYATYVATYTIPNIKYVWYYSGGTSIGVFFINETIFYLFIHNQKYKNYIQYQSVIIHMIFLHILPSFASVYCIVRGEKYPSISN